MAEPRNALETVERIIQRDGRYKMEAYSFVLAALSHTVRKFKESRHVGGRELLQGIKEYAKAQFGPMTRTVFEHWGVKSTEDFGHIVFSLVDAKLLGKTEQDSITDFKDGYDFKEVFG